MLKVGFIGFGNMAQALAQGWRQAQPSSTQLAMWACARDLDKLQRTTAPLQVQACARPQEVVEAADIIVLAVKPHQVEQVLADLRPTVVGGQPVAAEAVPVAPAPAPATPAGQLELVTELDYQLASVARVETPAEIPTPAPTSRAPSVVLPLEGKLIISVVAGLTPAQLRNYSWQDTTAIFTIPNTAVAVRQGMTVVSAEHTLSAAQLEVFNQLWSMVSKVEMVAPEQLAIAGTISGCTPAYTAMFMEALADAAVRHGLPRAQAYRCIAQMLVGVGTLQQELHQSPSEMKDAVCSPAGSTIRGVVHLEDEGFRGMVIRAIDAVMR